MDAEASKQRTGNNQEPDQRFKHDHKENCPTLCGSAVITHKQRKYRAKIDNGFRIGEIGQQPFHKATPTLCQLCLRYRYQRRGLFQCAAQHLVAHPTKIEAAAIHDEGM